MNSHPDREHLKALEMPTHKPWERLRKEADRMLESGESTITSGEPGEESLREWEAYGFHIREYPERDIDAPLDLVRVSVGGVAGEMGYLVFRGPVSEVKWVLRRALNALRSTPHPPPRTDCPECGVPRVSGGSMAGHIHLDHCPRKMSNRVRSSAVRGPTLSEAATEALHTLEALWEAFMDDRMPPMERWNDAMKGLRCALRDAKAKPHPPHEGGRDGDAPRHRRGPQEVGGVDNRAL